MVLAKRWSPLAPSAFGSPVVGERLGWLEQAQELSGNQIAIGLGINRRRWSSYRLGERELPISLAGELRRRYGCTLDWLYLGEEHANSEGFKQRLAEARRAAAHRDGRRRRFRQRPVYSR